MWFKAFSEFEGTGLQYRARRRPGLMRMSGGWCCGVMNRAARRGINDPLITVHGETYCCRNLKEIEMSLDMLLPVGCEMIVSWGEEMNVVCMTARVLER